MATNQPGIAITIKAWLPVEGPLEAQIEALTMVKQAHETGDYAPLLAAATIDEVKSEQRTRRVEKADPAPDPAPEPVPEPVPEDGAAMDEDDAP